MGRARRLHLPAVVLAGLIAASVQQPRAYDAERMREAAHKLGSRAAAAVQELQPMLNAARSLDEPSQLQVVNQFYNRRIAFVDDMLAWGQADHWATPLQTLALGQGDCEDYAIAKYFSLKALGVPGDQMRIVVVDDLNLKVPHAILVVYLDGRALILDNQIPTVVPADRIRHYRPIYSINEESWWLHRP